MDGWIKLHRKLYDHWIFSCSECLHLWLYLLLRVNHKPTEVVRGRTVVKLQAGQLIAGRKSLAEALKINEHKIDRTLKLFENEQLIEQQTFAKYRVITVTKWKEHQLSEQQVSNKRAASEQQVSTDKNVKNEENEKKYYGVMDNVIMSPERFEKLGQKMGEKARDDYINRLSTYEKIDTYKDHALVVMKWWAKDGSKVENYPVDSRRIL